MEGNLQTLVRRLQGELANKRDAIATEKGLRLSRQVAYCLRRIALRRGVDIASPLTRQTMREIRQSALADLLGRERKRALPLQWRDVWFAVTNAWRDCGVVVGEGGELVDKPLVPRGFRPVLSYVDSVEAMDELRAVLRGPLAACKIDVDGEDLFLLCGFVQSELPEVWQRVAMRFAS